MFCCIINYMWDNNRRFYKGDLTMNKKKVGLIMFWLISFIFNGCIKTNDTQATKDTVKVESKVEKSTEKKSTDDFTSKVDKLFTDYYGEDVFSGSVLIAKNNSIIFEKSYKMADYEKSIANTKETKYDIASLTKQITALSIMQLEEKGLIKVEDTVDKYLPCFPQGNKITIHHLLTHTSGLPQHPQEFDIRKFRPCNANNTVDKIDIKFQATPGQQFIYSNTGYILLGYIIEKISNKPLDEYYKENIFKPLDMKNTAFKDENFYLDNLAKGHATKQKDRTDKTWYDLEVGIVRGSAGLCSSVEDLYKWERALKNEKLINKASYEKVYKSYINNYGYGWWIAPESDNKKAYFHYGVAGGYRSYIGRNITDGTTVIILSNFGDTPLESMVYTLNGYLRQNQ